MLTGDLLKHKVHFSHC